MGKLPHLGKISIPGKNDTKGVEMVQLRNIPERVCSSMVCGKFTSEYIVIREAGKGIAEVAVCSSCFQARLERRRKHESHGRFLR